MKIRVMLKDPDTMLDAVDEAFRKAPKPDGLADDEWRVIVEGRIDSTRAHIAHKWMPYSEYLMVEFDIDAGTATVIPARDHDK